MPHFFIDLILLDNCLEMNKVNTFFMILQLFGTLFLCQLQSLNSTFPKFAVDKDL